MIPVSGKIGEQDGPMVNERLRLSLRGDTICVVKPKFYRRGGDSLNTGEFVPVLF